MGNTYTFIRTLTLTAALLAACGAACAETMLDLDFGWGQHVRAGTWTPVFVTLSDSRPRNVVLEINAPGGGGGAGQAMRIRQGAAIGPDPATFPLLAPLTYSLDDTVVTVRDAESGRTLAECPFADPFEPTSRVRNKEVLQSGDPLIAVSGHAPAMQVLERRQYGEQQTLNIGYLDAARLPAVAEGYASLDVLVLNQPNLDPSGAGARSLRFEQQQAIADWVRAGGNLIVWFGTDPLPASSPIVNVLPCSVDDFTPLAVTPDLLDRVGLPRRFAELQHRSLLAHAGAETFAILDSTGALACARRLGFGNVIVLSVDASSLQFENATAATRFWEPVLSRVIEKVDPAATTQPYYYQNRPEQRHAAAVQATMDLLGDVPGVGSFGFSYVAGVLIALMLVVGPIDWFVLKKLNKQPWTWVTTGGWIALVTCGALYVGHVFKSGDLHLRTLRLIDQADGQTVASIDFACIYSPRTTDYELKVDEQSWFRPPDLGQYYYGGRLGIETPYRQDFRGNRPEAMRINVWNLKFIQGQKIQSGPPMIAADLRVSANDRVVGTIANTSGQPMRRILIRLQKGQAVFAGPIEPGQTATVDLPVEALAKEFQRNQDFDKPYYYGYYGNYASEPGVLNYNWSGLLSEIRSERIDQMLGANGDLACVYAELSNPPGAATLTTPGAKEQHWRLVRALVHLGSPAEQTP